MTEKAVIKEIIIPFKLNITELTTEDEVALTSVAKKMKNDPLLFIEMSSFHVKSVVAIKRTTIIKDFFVEHGIDQQRFDVLWHGSDEQNQVQLKLYRNE
jgi:outer membrane protein OmpA-like peptidoglycan-associated protein